MQTKVSFHCKDSMPLYRMVPSILASGTLTRMRWATPLWILIVYVSLARFGVEAKLLDSETNILQSSNVEIRSVNTSYETKPAERTYDPAYVLHSVHKCLWPLMSYIFRISSNSSIVKSTENDISNGVTFFYLQQAPVSKHSKRTMSRPIRNCPPGHDFLWSLCSRFHGLEQWSLVCRPQQGVPHGNGLHWGKCRPDEICIEGRSAVQAVDRESEGYYASTAWCVGKDNFVPLAKLLANGKSRGASVETGFHPTVGQQYSVEAVLANSDSRTPLKAQSLEIQAQTADTVGSVQAWRTLNAGDNQCSDCASVGILGVPEGTQRIKAHVEVKPGTVNGLLYLASVGG